MIILIIRLAYGVADFLDLFKFCYMGLDNNEHVESIILMTHCGSDKE